MFSIKTINYSISNFLIQFPFVLFGRTITLKNYKKWYTFRDILLMAVPLPFTQKVSNLLIEFFIGLFLCFFQYQMRFNLIKKFFPGGFIKSEDANITS